MGATAGGRTLHSEPKLQTRGGVLDGRLFIVGLCLLVGCADVGANNPFDPSTPASQQAPARVSGAASLPDDFDAALLEGAVASLWRLDGGDEPAATTVCCAEGSGLAT